MIFTNPINLIKINSNSTDMYDIEDARLCGNRGGKAVITVKTSLMVIGE
jgi:hypothetical protein